MNAKIKVLILICLATFLLPTSVVFALLESEYTGQIKVTNTGEEKTGVAGAFALNTQNLIDAGMLNEFATDAAVHTADDIDVAFMPGIGEHPWVFEIPNISQNAEQYYYLNTGGVTDGILRYFPDADGMTTDYDLSLELGDTFVIKQKGYINSLATGIVSIPNADMEANSKWTGGAQSGVQKHGGAKSWYLTATAAAPNGNVAVYATAFQDLDWISVYQGQEFTLTGWIYCSQSQGGGWGRLQLDDGVGAPTSSTTVLAASWTEVSVTRALDNSATRLRVIMQVSSGSGSYDQTYTSNAYFDDLEFTSSVTGASKLVYKPGAFITYIDSGGITSEILGTGISVTASPIDSGVRTVKTWADGNEFGIIVDEGLPTKKEGGPVSVGAGVTPLPDIGWEFITNGSMLYMEYHKIWVGGTEESDLMQWIEWEYDTIFEDKSANGHQNDANPSFLESTSDPDITVVLLSFQPTGALETEPIYQPEATWELITDPDPPEEPANLYGGGDMTFLGAGFIQEVADMSDMPLVILVYAYAFGCAILFGLLAYKLTMGKHGRGSLLVQALVSLIVMVYFVITGIGVIPAWVLLPFGFEALAAIIWRQSISPW